MAGQPDGDKHGKPAPQNPSVDDGPIAEDDTGPLQLLNPRRQADAERLIFWASSALLIRPLRSSRTRYCGQSVHTRH